MDRNLRACGRHGHETYAPDELALRERLHVATPVGEAWRCLRCGTFVVGEVAASGPADQAPEVPRGRLLRDRTIMRLLAAERVIRGAALFFVAFLIIRFRGREQELKDTFNNDVTLLRPVAEQLGWSMDNSKIVRGISRVFELSPAALTWITIGVIGYGTLQLVEAYGLWTMSRWGEYLAVVATSIFLPWEIYEVTEKVTVIRLGALIINIAAVLWLLWSKRLFGLRGGAAAYHREHSAESLLTVERAAVFAASGSVVEAPAAGPLVAAEPSNDGGAQGSSAGG